MVFNTPQFNIKNPHFITVTIVFSSCSEYFRTPKLYMMKSFFRKQNNYIRLSLLAVVLTVAACSKSGRSDDGPGTVPDKPNVAEKTPVGTPIGSPEQKTIGPNG